METTKEKIIEAVFSGWCDRDYGNKGKELPVIDQTIMGIGEHFNASEEDQLYIEAVVMNAICENEKMAFMQGFEMCLELLNGSLFQ